MEEIQIDGKTLQEGKLYLRETGAKSPDEKPLYSVYFITPDNRFYEIVFAPNDTAPIWYFMEKEVTTENPRSDDPNTLAISVRDKLKLSEQIS